VYTYIETAPTIYTTQSYYDVIYGDSSYTATTTTTDDSTTESSYYSTTDSIYDTVDSDEFDNYDGEEATTTWNFDGSKTECYTDGYCY
jgi:hypothetical protein